MRSIGYHLRIGSSSVLGSHPVEEILDELLDDCGVDLVDDLLPLALRQDEAGFAKHSEVARHGRPARGEVFGDGAGGLRSFAEEPEDLAARRVAEGTERIVHKAKICVIS